MTSATTAGRTRRRRTTPERAAAAVGLMRRLRRGRSPAPGRPRRAARRADRAGGRGVRHGAVRSLVAEGPQWLEAVLRALPEAGVRGDDARRCVEAGHVGGRVELGGGSVGSGKDWRVWDGEAVADLVDDNARLRAACRKVLETMARLVRGIVVRDQFARTTCWRPSSDWAFMVTKDSAAGYARDRHAGTTREARRSPTWSSAARAAARPLPNGCTVDGPFGPLDARLPLPWWDEGSNGEGEGSPPHRRIVSSHSRGQRSARADPARHDGPHDPRDPDAAHRATEAPPVRQRRPRRDRRAAQRRAGAALLGLPQKSRGRSGPRASDSCAHAARWPTRAPASGSPSTASATAPSSAGAPCTAGTRPSAAHRWATATPRGSGVTAMRPRPRTHWCPGGSTRSTSTVSTRRSTPATTRRPGCWRVRFRPRGHAARGLHRRRRGLGHLGLRLAATRPGPVAAPTAPYPDDRAHPAPVVGVPTLGLRRPGSPRARPRRGAGGRRPRRRRRHPAPGSERLADDEVVTGVRVVRVPHDPPAIPMSDLLAWVMALNHALTRARLRLGRTGGPEVLHGHDWLVAHARPRSREAYGVPLVATMHATEAGRRQGWLPDGFSTAIHTDRVVVDLRGPAGDHLLAADAVGGRAAVRAAAGQGRRGAQRHRPRASGPRRRRGRSRARALRRQGSARGVRRADRVGEGLHTLIEAMPRLRRRFPGLRLVVVGQGLPAEALDLRATPRGSRMGPFAGWLGRAGLRCRVSAAANVAVVPSVYEPFGLVALEAAAAGTPLVVGGHRRAPRVRRARRDRAALHPRRRPPGSPMP